MLVVVTNVGDEDTLEVVIAEDPGGGRCTRLAGS